jgi:hypothetical protein
MPVAKGKLSMPEVQISNWMLEMFYRYFQNAVGMHIKQWMLEMFYQYFPH